MSGHRRGQPRSAPISGAHQFKLRLKFHNESLTAEDVKFSFFRTKS